MPNPNIPLGSLNRLRASVSIINFPGLNVTASFLGREALRLALDGESTTMIPTMTGTVTSPEPYMMSTLTMHLLKTQALAAAYKLQMETDARIGDLVVRPDASTLPPFDLINTAIEAVREMSYSGADAGFIVAIRGYYQVNAALWDAA